jgi:hypothetical protein
MGLHCVQQAPTHTSSIAAPNSALSGVIVLFMHTGDAQQAWASYQDFLDVPEFSNSPEAFAAENLMQAYGSGRTDYIQQATRQGRSWDGLDGQVRLSTFATWFWSHVRFVRWSADQQTPA